jgi:hypothetical protein
VTKKVEDTVKDPAGSVGDTLTRAEATAQCTAKGITNPIALADCVDGLLG